MAYKTLLTVLTDPDRISRPLDQAIALSEAYQAHVDAVCLGLDLTQAGFFYAGADVAMIQSSVQQATEDAGTIEAAVRKQLDESGVLYATDKGVAQLADLGRHVARAGRFCDLAVFGRPYGEGQGSDAEAVVEAALFGARVPVLIVPDEGPVLRSPQRVVVAWNSSVEAMCAIRAAIPVLKEAQTVHVTVIDPPSHGPERSDPGGALAQFLARHDIRCEIDVLSKTMPRVSEILNRHVTDKDADLVVMGAYGHSRLSEAIIGGSTREMLEHAPVPVLMAH